MERGWVWGSLLYSSNQVRTGHLLLGMLKTPALRNLLASMSPELAKIGADDPGGLSVSQLACMIRSALDEDRGLQAEFERLLRLTGWREGVEREPYVATVTQMELYAVTETFPALTRASVPDGVVEADYEIRLPQPTEIEVLN